MKISGQNLLILGLILIVILLIVYQEKHGPDVSENSMNKCIVLHRTKPWVPNFKRVLIRPLRKVNEAWLGQEVDIGGKVWNLPTDAFWEVHCNASHEGGAGCDVDIHTSFLTSDGSNAEFEYASELDNGEVQIQTEKEFNEECDFWKTRFENLLVL